MPYAHFREMTVEHDGELRLNGLPVRAGEKVEVVVIRRHETASKHDRYPLHGHPLEYSDPFEPAVAPEEWESNR